MAKKKVSRHPYTNELVLFVVMIFVALTFVIIFRDTNDTPVVNVDQTTLDYSSTTGENTEFSADSIDQYVGLVSDTSKNEAYLVQTEVNSQDWVRMVDEEGNAIDYAPEGANIEIYLLKSASEEETEMNTFYFQTVKTTGEETMMQIYGPFENNLETLFQ